MLTKIREWFGFTGDPAADHHHNAHHHHEADHAHKHTHGVVDATLATTARGIFAIKWSFIILAVTAALQLGVVMVSGSVALLADTIHNIGDATTAIPLWVAFLLARRKPTAAFTYGYGRVEDLAGIIIVLIILISALVAGNEAVNRFIHPQDIGYLSAVAAAGVIGFAGNETVAVFRIRIGREINSAALIADGYHARTDGLTSLAVVAGALGVWLGFPLADPIIGLLITIAILGIVWQSSRAVLTRMLDGIDPDIVGKIRDAAEHVSGLRKLGAIQARWLGHRLHAEVAIAVDSDLPMTEAHHVAEQFKDELFEHVPALAEARIRVVPEPAK